MTAAVKNLYGVIPGTVKSEYHFRYPDPMAFANMLVDLNEFVRPALCLCDAVDIMEGNGPTNGSPSSDMTISVRTPITMLSMHLPSKKPLVSRLFRAGKHGGNMLSHPAPERPKYC